LILENTKNKCRIEED